MKNTLSCPAALSSFVCALLLAAWTGAEAPGGEETTLSEPTYDWERQTGTVNEGPIALQRDGRTWIVYAASACWGPDYKLGMLTYVGGEPQPEESRGAVTRRTRFDN